jgi:cytochrome c oxidase accessory protein FixG
MGNPSFEARITIFPRSVKGVYRYLKTGILIFAYVVYFLLPWLRWERINGPDQAVLFDLVGRRFYLFDLVVYAQDIFWLAGLLVIFAMLLFFVTGVAGRVWCGYFCFQTLWTDVFYFIEHMVQGERNARIKLSQSPWNANKIIRMSLTWFLWLLISLMTGLAFTLYWGNAPDLLLQMLQAKAPFSAYATTLFLMATTYVMAGLAREQTCTYMCPYARFQGVMFDEDTAIVAYDESRGERGSGRQKPSKGLMDRDSRIKQNVGDCIDCGFCVQVCPVGIDIRNGQQYQCISCALCIDACDTIMQSIDYPKGLIRYTSENKLQGKKSSPLNFKNIGYGLVLAVTIALLVWSVITRSILELSARQIRQPLYVELSDGSIQNRYVLKINNKTELKRIFSLSITGLEKGKLKGNNLKYIEVPAEGSIQIHVKVTQPAFIAKEKRTQLQFNLNAIETPEKLTGTEVDSMFYVPAEKLVSAITKKK